MAKEIGFLMIDGGDDVGSGEFTGLSDAATERAPTASSSKYALRSPQRSSIPRAFAPTINVVGFSGSPRRWTRSNT